MKLQSTFAFLMVGILLLSCSKTLMVQQISATPEELGIGDQGLVTVTMKGPKNSIKSITATVREESSFTFQLNDGGKNGDITAGDNVWSFQIQVPYEAPPGTYNLEFSVVDMEGNELVVDGYQNQYYGKSGNLPVKVK